MRIDENGRVDLGRAPWLMNLAFHVAGEPLRWATTETRLVELLARHGLRFEEDRARYDLRRRFLEPAGLGELKVGTLERLGVAESVAD